MDKRAHDSLGGVGVAVGGATVPSGVDGAAVGCGVGTAGEKEESQYKCAK